MKRLLLAVVFNIFILTPTSVIADSNGTAVMTLPKNIVWEPYGGGVPLQIAKVWGDRTKGEYGMYLKFPPKFDSGMHMHSADYHGIALQGNWVHSIEGGESVELAPMSIVMQPAKQYHNDLCKGPEECVIFVHMKAKHDYVPKPAPAVKK